MSSQVRSVGAARRPLITFWRVVFAVIMLAGALATYVRFVRGLGASTNLSDAFPWGLWIGFDILVGVGLAAGGFVISSVVHVFNIKRYEPVARPAVLTAFLGYLLVSVALLFDVGQPWHIWHPLVMWNPHSVMFEVAWCVMLYTAVLAIEFSPMLLERFGLHRPLRVVRALYVPFVIAGTLLSMMHQSSLGTLFVIMPGKLHGLWYTPWLPVFFFITAVAAGLGMTIIESYLSGRAFGHRLDDSLLRGLARVAVVLLGVYAVWKFEDLAGQGNLGLVFKITPESVMFWGEMGLGVFLPIVLFAIPSLRRNRHTLFLGAVLMVMGFIVHRLNVSITGMPGGLSYFPSWMEVAITAALVAVGFAAFAWAAKNLAVFGSHGEEHSVDKLANQTNPAPASPRFATVNGAGLLALWGLLAIGFGLTALARPSKAAPPAEPATTQNLKMPPSMTLPAEFTFSRGKDSPGEVTFNHETHVGRMDRPECASCHREKGFSLRGKGNPMTGVVNMSRMKAGELCGTCHNGKEAIAVSECSICHQ
jgi:c(7)-type cytochrome triheme protein